MGLFSIRRSDASPVDREAELWDLIGTLQREKEALRIERDQLCVELDNLRMGTPAPGPTVLGRHVTLAGLRMQAELRSRQQAAKMRKDNDAS